MNKITKPQLGKLHVLLTQLNLLEHKADFVFEFTNGRATSSRDMSQDEATELIKHLSRYDPCDRMRRKVFSLAYEAGIIYGDSWEDKRMNAAKLNLFIVDRGTVKKPLNKMCKEELVKVVTQFAQIVIHKNYSQASKLTRGLLDELNIQTENKTKFKRH